MSAPGEILSFDELVARLALTLNFDPAGRTPTSGLYTDVGLDSIDATEVVLAVEALAAHPNPAVDLPILQTLGDVFAYYRALVDQLPA